MEKIIIFNSKQNEIKNKLLHDIFDLIFKALRENEELFDIQSVINIFFSVLVFFNRDMLVHIFLNLGQLQTPDDLIDELSEIVKKEVKKVINKRMM